MMAFGPWAEKGQHTLPRYENSHMHGVLWPPWPGRQELLGGLSGCLGGFNHLVVTSWFLGHYWALSVRSWA